MEIKEKPFLNDLVNKVLEHLRTLKRGDVILISTIEQLTGCEKYSEHWNSIINKLKRKFKEESGIAIWSFEAGSYKLPTVEEQLSLIPRKRQQRATRQLTRSVGEVLAIPSGELSDHQKNRRAMAVNHMIAVRQSIKRNVREQGMNGGFTHQSISDIEAKRQGRG